MQQNSIHEEAGHRDQHWVGGYFGSGGALEVARTDYQEKADAVLGDIDATWVERQDALLRATMRRMSTVYSAIGHCASQVALRRLNNKLWYAWQAFLLLFKLEDMLSQVLGRGDYEQPLAPGERDVLIAALLLPSPVAWFHFNFWYRGEAVELIRYQMKHLPPTHVSYLYAMARGYRVGSGHFSEGERELFFDVVHHAIYAYAPDGSNPQLAWSDVARLARLIGHKDRQRQAAGLDGSRDAKLKAGVGD